ncbi:MAG TPA: DNA topology modulation protein [Symbiobacteriaceae bacterium]|jgi:adenylate kinase family enzyme|nr:DNA topology modulation protein [Symbiobacteriaceae bacterium]
MQRIILIGSGGSGKSTLARQLGEVLNLPVIHLDALYWKPGWVETPRPEWEAVQRELVARDRWVMDGNYGHTLDIRLAAADTVIFMDVSRWVCLWGAIKRRITYAGRSRPDMNPGCPEQLDWQFLRWIWEFPTTRRPRLEAKLANLRPDQTLVRIRSRSEGARFVEALRTGAALGAVR